MVCPHRSDLDLNYGYGRLKNRIWPLKLGGAIYLSYRIARAFSILYARILLLFPCITNWRSEKLQVPLQPACSYLPPQEPPRQSHIQILIEANPKIRKGRYLTALSFETERYYTDYGSNYIAKLELDTYKAIIQIGIHPGNLQSIFCHLLNKGKFLQRIA